MGWPYDKYLWREDVSTVVWSADPGRNPVEGAVMSAQFFTLPLAHTPKQSRLHTHMPPLPLLAPLHMHMPPQAKPAKKQYAAVAKAISQFEPVTMWADPSVAEEAKQYLADAPNVTVQVRAGAASRLLSVTNCVSQTLGQQAS